MDKASIPSYTTRMLCSNKGALVYGHLYKSVSEKYNISNQLFCELLKNGSRFVIVQGSEDKIPGRGVSPDSKVIAKTSVRLCNDYPKDCGDCEGLHLCKYFVYGNCRFNAGSKCRFSHDLRSIHNIPVLRANQLQDLEDDELCQLLLQNDPSLLPECCHPPSISVVQDKHQIQQQALKHKCRFSHDLRSIHNIPVLRANQLQDLEDDELCQLLLQNDPSLLPELWVPVLGQEFTNNNLSSARHTTVCIKPFRSFSGASIYVERAGELDLLVNEQAGRRERVYCFRADSPQHAAVFLQASPQRDISRRTVGFQYELLSNHSWKPDFHRVAEMEGEGAMHARCCLWFCDSDRRLPGRQFLCYCIRLAISVAPKRLAKCKDYTNI
ncbi:UNVERIFIED_CONTAM: hypothetical protein FKN15_060451 [Acipenser sinensis]